MLILLDENLPHGLRILISGHEVRTVAYQGWKSLSNGVLLKAAEDAGFDVMITADQGIRYQQNLRGLRLAIIVLSSNEWTIVTAHIQEIMAAINTIEAGDIVTVDIGR